MYVSYHYNDMEKLKLLTTFYITLDWLLRTSDSTAEYGINNKNTNKVLLIMELWNITCEINWYHNH